VAYPLLLHPLVLDRDVPTLGTEVGLDEQAQLDLRKELVRQLVAIEHEPWIGRPMRRRPGYEILADCHSLTFDLRSRKKKPRFRIVFKLDPSVEAIHRVLVYAVGPRPDLEAYRRARARRRAADWP
jgi:hypothetical protein